MDRRNWEQRDAVVALYESNRELKSQRLELHQATQCADQAQRENTNLFGASDMRNRIFQNNSAKDSKKLRIYEESVAKKQIEPYN